MALSGLSASPLMASSTALAVKTVLSSYGKHAANPMGCGSELASHNCYNVEDFTEEYHIFCFYRLRSLFYL